MLGIFLESDCLTTIQLSATWTQKYEHDVDAPHAHADNADPQVW